MNRLYANAMPFYYKGLEHPQIFGISRGPGTNSPWILKDDCVIIPLRSMLAIPTLPSAKLFSLKKEKLAQIGRKTENKQTKKEP